MRQLWEQYYQRIENFHKNGSTLLHYGDLGGHATTVATQLATDLQKKSKYISPFRISSKNRVPRHGYKQYFATRTAIN